MHEAFINRILVVCTGNICRSPMGVALLKNRFNNNSQRNIKVISAGLNALVGESADPLAKTVMARNGIDISSHRARQLKPNQVSWADLILVMDRFQKQSIELEYPSARGKVFRLGEWSDIDIADPYGQSERAFESTYENIYKCIDDWISKIGGDLKL